MDSLSLRIFYNSYYERRFDDHDIIYDPDDYARNYDLWSPVYPGDSRRLLCDHICGRDRLCRTNCVDRQALYEKEEMNEREKLKRGLFPLSFPLREEYILLYGTKTKIL